jgi:sterol desaturase/sphingolipid hydroxylase (fatty acid hydroxylase superfamily)
MQGRLFISAKNETPRMFKNPILESLTRVHWTTPLVCYVPMMVWLLYRSLSVFAVSWPRVGGLFLGGVAFWTLAEYGVHRFLFHYEPKTQWGRKIHWYYHGIHHDYPSDAWRLVLPPVLSIPLAVGFYGIYTTLLGKGMGSAFFAGFLLGYVSYETLHYGVHHFVLKGPWLSKLRAHHLKHHFKNPQQLFGVSSPFWDFVFRTHRG